MSTLSDRLLALDILLECDPEDAEIVDFVESHGGEVRNGIAPGMGEAWEIEMLGIAASDETLWDAAVNWAAAARATIEAPRTFAALVNPHPLELAAERRRAAL